MKNGRVHFYLTSLAISGVSSTQIVSDNEWHHVLLVRGNNALKLYIDGNFEASEGDTYFGTSDALDCTSENSLYLGGGRDLDGTQYLYSGYLDEVRLFNVALTPEEVGDLHASDAPSFGGSARRERSSAWAAR